MLNKGIKDELTGEELRIVLNVFLLAEPLVISFSESSLYQGVCNHKWNLSKWSVFPLCEKYVTEVFSLYSKFTEILCLAKLSLISGT